MGFWNFRCGPPSGSQRITIYLTKTKIEAFSRYETNDLNLDSLLEMSLSDSPGFYCYKLKYKCTYGKTVNEHFSPFFPFPFCFVFLSTSSLKRKIKGQKEMPYFLTSENGKLFEIKKTKTKQKLSTSYLFRIISSKLSNNKINIPSPF